MRVLRSAQVVATAAVPSACREGVLVVRDEGHLYSEEGARNKNPSRGLAAPDREVLGALSIGRLKYWAPRVRVLHKVGLPCREKTPTLFYFLRSSTRLKFCFER